MIYILPWKSRKNQKTFSRPLHFKLKKIQHDFSRTSPKIQRLLKTVRTMRQLFKSAFPSADRRLANWANRTAIKHTVHRKRSTLAGYHPRRGEVTPWAVCVRTTNFFSNTDGQQVGGSRFSRGVDLPCAKACLKRHLLIPLKTFS